MTKARPYLVNGDDAVGQALVPLPARRNTFQEEWLQELLYKHPSILPVDCLDEAFAPPISIGREIAGIDNLFISPKGLLTVVETKLWRNPEAHRVVVAQILDYAHTLAGWDYRKLDESVRSFMEKQFGQPKSIFDIVKRKAVSLDFGEVEFQERVHDCLQNGRFALLIVGDKVFPGATQLAETIQSAPHLQYSIGFVELQCYKLTKESDWPLIVFPSFVAKTKEITRAVVKVIYEHRKPDIEVVTPEEGKPTGYTTFSEFVASLPSTLVDVFKSYIERWMKAGYIVYWGKVGFSVRIPWKGRARTVFDAYPTTASILQTRWAKEFDLPSEPYNAYRAELMTSPAISSAFAAGKRYLNFENMSEDEVALLLASTDKLMRGICCEQ